MRPYKKYKNFSKHRTLLKFSPFLRVLKFKRTKWLAVQKLISFFFVKGKLKLKQKKFHNNLSISSPLQRYQRLNRFYAEGVYLKRVITSLFDNRFSTNRYKSLLNAFARYLTYEEKYILLVIKPFFYLDILLWKAGFFKSSYEALQHIYAGKVLVNGVPVFSPNLLAKEDIVSFACPLDIKNFLPKTFLASFVEIDAYLQQIVVLKSFEAITGCEASLLISDSLDINAFLGYLNSH